MVPITIITGFLGAGKTSLLNHLLTNATGERLAVLVNDFGAVNIDADLIRDQDEEIISLQNGCICCSLSGGLLAAVSGVIRRADPPDRIVVETSGVSDPMEIIATLADPELRLYAPIDGIVTVVDAETAPDLSGESLVLARAQIVAADLVLLNKTDLIDEAKTAIAEEWVRAAALHSRIAATRNAEIPPEAIFGLARSAETCAGSGDHRHDHHAHAESGFESFTFESSDPLPLRQLHGLLAVLPTSVLRVKGFLRLAEKPEHRCVLQFTGKRATITVGEPWGEIPRASQIVFIGTRGGVDGDWIAATLSGPAPV